MKDDKRRPWVKMMEGLNRLPMSQRIRKGPLLVGKKKPDQNKPKR